MSLEIVIYSVCTMQTPPSTVGKCPLAQISFFDSLPPIMTYLVTYFGDRLFLTSTSPKSIQNGL